MNAEVQTESIVILDLPSEGIAVEIINLPEQMDTNDSPEIDFETDGINMIFIFKIYFNFLTFRSYISTHGHSK